MTELVVLGALKFAGLIVGAASTFWGIIGKPVFQDSDGKRHLTHGGKVTFGIAGFSFLLSLVAFGFETMAEIDDQKAAHAATVAKAATVALDSQKDLMSAVRQGKILSQQVTERLKAGERAREAQEDRFQNFLAEQERDAQSARRITLENQENLAQINSTLDGVERLLRPLGEISGFIVWQLHLNSKASETLRLEADCVNNPGANFNLRFVEPTKTDRSTLVLQDRELKSLLNRSHVVVNFGNASQPPKDLRDLGENSRMVIEIPRKRSRSGDLMEFACSNDTVTIATPILSEQISRQPDFRSFLDLEKSEVRVAVFYLPREPYTATLGELEIKSGDSVYKVRRDDVGVSKNGIGFRSPVLFETKLERIK